jgi:cell division protein FtsB
MKRKRFGEPPKVKRKKIMIFLFFFVLLGAVFLPGPNGLVRVLYKNYKKKQFHKQIEQLKIKAELIEAKIDKGHNEEYLRKYLQDNYNMVLKDSLK